MMQGGRQSRAGSLMRAMGAVCMLAVIVMLGACAHTAREPHVWPPRTLASPASGGEHSVSQVVRGAVGKREMTLSCAVSVKDGVMSVIGLNAVGVRLFTLSYDGNQVKVEKAAGVPDAIEPERLLADLQLVYWPLSPLQQVLRPAGYEVAEPAPGTRRLRRGDRLIAEVHYDGDDAWKGRAWLVDLEYGYSLQIDSVPL